MKNNMIPMIIAVIVIGAGAFFGGMQYQKSKVQTNFRGQFAGARNGQGGFAGRNGNAQGARPVTGEILSTDDTSITVKMQDGSSKIIILSGTTTINKATTGSKADLKIGERISAFGIQNSDGSMTAQNVSIGGNLMRRPQGGSITPTPKA